jgi:hypothetical protein
LRKLLLVLTLIAAVPGRAAAQSLHIDAARDLGLLTSVRGFLEGALSAAQLETELREYAREFEARPYKVGVAKIEWDKVPQERLFAFMRITSRLNAPVHEEYFKGELSAAQAAIKIAPFLLMWPGYGMDPPANDPLSRQRTEHLLATIREYSAPADDFLFGTVAEAYTSPDAGTGVNAAPRMFLVPDNVCATAPRPAALHAPSDAVELHAGQPFPFNSLVIVARDEAGAVLPRVPIVIEVERIAPPLLNAQSNAMPENHLHPIRPGSFRIRARTWCGDKPVQVDMPAVVR